MLFFSTNTPDFDTNSPHKKPYNTLRIGVHDKFLSLTPLFTPTWFSVPLLIASLTFLHLKWSMTLEILIIRNVLYPLKLPNL